MDLGAGCTPRAPDALTDLLAPQLEFAADVGAFGRLAPAKHANLPWPIETETDKWRPSARTAWQPFGNPGAER